MLDVDEPGDAGDPHGLGRFVEAQEGDYDQALAEIRSGRKRSHWMWYIFPQLDGLGFSSTSGRYSIKSLAEAKAYLGHPVLGSRLLEIAEEVVRIEGRSAYEIFGSPDDMKLRSCATLFACVSPAGSVFDRLLAKYYQGERDGKTLRLAGIASEGKQVPTVTFTDARPVIPVIGVAGFSTSGRQTVVVDPRTRRIAVKDTNRFSSKSRSIPFGDVVDVSIGFLGKISSFVTWYYLVPRLESGEEYPLFSPGRFFAGGSDRSTVEDRRRRLEEYLGQQGETARQVTARIHG